MGIVIIIAFFALNMFIDGFIVGSFYGMSDADSIWSWIKSCIHLIKESSDEAKAERAFVKANPLCAKCLESGKYRKSRRMWIYESSPIAYCDNCYRQEWEKRMERMKE